MVPLEAMVLIISLTLVVYFLSIKTPWKTEAILPSTFFKTLYSFILFVIIAKTLDFFLAISVLSLLVSHFWGEKRIFYLFGKKGQYRGDHAHKKCKQLFIPLSGSVSLIMKRNGKEKKINLNYFMFKIYF